MKRGESNNPPFFLLLYRFRRENLVFLINS